MRKEDYPALLVIFDDGDVFFESWEDWLKKAKETEAAFKMDGYVVERIYLDPVTFGDWCRQEGIGTGRGGRTKYAADFVARKYGTDH
jgi:hypothetical protein